MSESDSNDDDDSRWYWPFGGNATEESDTERNGFLSYSAEVHAVGHGMFMGFRTRPWERPPEPTHPDAEKEPHYYQGGFVFGSVLQVVLIVVLVKVVGLDASLAAALGA